MQVPTATDPRPRFKIMLVAGVAKRASCWP